MNTLVNWLRRRLDPTKAPATNYTDPRIFWEQWAETFDQSPTQQQIYPQHELIRKKLEELKPASVLEIGCGFGRNIKWLSEQLSFKPRFIGIDISQTLIKKAQILLTNVSRLELHATSLLEIPSHITADVVLIHGVFMHIRSNEIVPNFAATTRLAQKGIIQIEEIRREGDQLLEQPINSYTFAHDYKTLYKTSPDLTVKEIKFLPHQLLWIYAEPKTR